MQKKLVLNALSAAHKLTVKTLKMADKLFYRQRRSMEDSYGMTHGTFTTLKMKIFPRTSS